MCIVHNSGDIPLFHPPPSSPSPSQDRVIVLLAVTMVTFICREMNGVFLSPVVFTELVVLTNSMSQNDTLFRFVVHRFSPEPYGVLFQDAASTASVCVLDVTQP